jgi:hypothetical protein
MATPILTRARHAVADAIAQWPALTGTFRRRYLFEDDPGGMGGEPSPSMGDLPALGIFPDAVESTWVLNQAQEIRYPMRIDLWTRAWDVRQGEYLWEEIVKSLHQSLPTADGRVKRLVGFSSLAPRSMALGSDRAGPSATRWSFRVEVSAGFWNPRTAGT